MSSSHLTWAERLWLSPGPVLGGHPHGRLLLHGFAVVRSSHSHFHRPHRLSEDGERVQRSWRAATVSWCAVSHNQTSCVEFSTSILSCSCEEHYVCVCCREQRLTGILVFVLTGVSVFLAPILQVIKTLLLYLNEVMLTCILSAVLITVCISAQYIPMPVLYGVFLYMGVASLHGIQVHVAL